MLNALKLTNVRRHAYTEIDFTGDAQIILIAGRNGAGKSTLLEAIQFALYGETRHGRRGIAAMVRRGAEFEGMQVELTMTLGGVHYEVLRRYERGKSSAQLLANGNAVMRTPDGVTAEVTRVLGMDAVGFKLATIAKQKELDGLADLTATKRKQVLTRLLRLDAVTKAAKEARDRYLREKDIAEALAGGPDAEQMARELAEAQREAREAEGALQSARDSLSLLDAELAATADVEAAWSGAQIAVARAEATLVAAAAEADRVRVERDRVVVPDAMPEPAIALEQVRAQLLTLDTEIARAEAAVDLARAAESTRAELTKATARLAEVDAALGSDRMETIAQQLSALAAQQDTATATAQQLEERRTELLDALGQVRGRIAHLTERVHQAGQLADVCDTCEQEISQEHRTKQAQTRAQALAAAQAEEADVLTRGNALRIELTQVRGQVEELAGQTQALTARRVEVAALQRERTDLSRRIDMYTTQLERVQVPEVDLDALYARKGTLECLRAEGEAYATNAAARQGALERLADLEAALEAAHTRLEAARTAVEAAAPSQDLLDAHAQRAALAANRVDEHALVEACATAAAVAAERVVSARKQEAAHAERQEKIRAHKEAAIVASKTHQLLQAVAAKMATQIRPALEGQISGLLQQLSEGRFVAVKVSDDYEITVCDRDGRYYPVSEFSGGEADLIALATRLALANVVAQRHGVGGAGFLILDEVFGSQDAARRQSILDGLRRLRGLYGQILLISHVGGIDEAADRVLEIGDGEDSGLAMVEAA